MNARIRAIIGLGILVCGLTAQAALERATATERPVLEEVAEDATHDPWRLDRPGCGDGRGDPPADAGRRFPQSGIQESPASRMLVEIVDQLFLDGAQPASFARSLLAVGGLGEERVQSVVKQVARPGGNPTRIMCLGYSQGDMVQGVGFWYYIFGEGSVERYVRQLPITSRSSHGRTTRGSGLTVEVFGLVSTDPDGEALVEFASALLDELEPLLPLDRAPYFLP